MAADISEHSCSVLQFVLQLASQAIGAPTLENRVHREETPAAIVKRGREEMKSFVDSLRD